MKRSAEEEEIHEIIKDLIENIKVACIVIHTQMADADVLKVSHSMGDPYSLALQRQIERRLEVIMPEEELPEGNEIVCMVGSVSPIMTEIKDMIISLMDHMVEAYYQVGLAAEWFLALAKVCTPEQIMVIMCFAAQPLIQLEGSHEFP